MNNTILFNPLLSSNECENNLSFSLVNYLKQIKMQLRNLCNSEENDNFFTVEQLSKIVNPYEYIFSKVPNLKYSVSKLKPFSNLFYDFLEISNNLSLFDNFGDMNLKAIHFGMNHSSTIECMNMIREDKNDQHIGVRFENENIKEDVSLKAISQNSIDFLFYELDDCNYKNMNLYIIGLLKIVVNIFAFQKQNGVSVIKIDTIYHKPISDILYILSNIYEKVYIIKPNTNNIISSEKYIVCKSFVLDDSKLIDYCGYYKLLTSFISANHTINEKSLYISSIVDNDMQYFFLKKLEEFNIIVGQQQMEAMDQLISILKNKNKDDKLETLKKNNIQKCIVWCEKFKIPHNKLNEKINIFLPIIKIEEEVVDITSESEEIPPFPPLRKVEPNLPFLPSPALEKVDPNLPFLPSPALEKVDPNLPFLPSPSLEKVDPNLPLEKV